jgi:FKBP-type peptidyl-prolyl cis-trans isomerase (trigger factor)
MYPEIEIEDGEGMPYSNPKKRITDGEVKVENP